MSWDGLPWLAATNQRSRKPMWTGATQWLGVAPMPEPRRAERTDRRPTRCCAPPFNHSPADFRRSTRGVLPGRPRGRRLLSGSLEPRQGGAVHARGELHRLVLVEGLREGRDHHLKESADRLPLGRTGLAGVRAAWLPARRGVLLVHLLPHPDPLSLRPPGAARDVPRGKGPSR